MRQAGASKLIVRVYVLDSYPGHGDFGFTA